MLVLSGTSADISNKIGKWHNVNILLARQCVIAQVKYQSFTASTAVNFSFNGPPGGVDG